MSMNFIGQIKMFMVSKHISHSQSCPWTVMFLIVVMLFVVWARPHRIHSYITKSTLSFFSLLSFLFLFSPWASNKSHTKADHQVQVETPGWVMEFAGTRARRDDRDKESRLVILKHIERMMKNERRQMISIYS